MMKRKKVRENEGFVFRSGQVVETKDQLVAVLKTLNLEVFRYHVNDQKNDIYNWLRDCLDSKLAETIKDVRDPKRMIALLK
jgi:hypothetical protein